VWIDGALVIDNATPHDARIDKATVALQAGRRYALRVDATERTGEAALKLLWYAPDGGQRIVPTRQLYPAP
jgi:alpha-L-fucosidase